MTERNKYIKKINKFFKSGASINISAVDNGFTVQIYNERGNCLSDEGPKSLVVTSLEELNKLLAENLTYATELNQEVAAQSAQAELVKIKAETEETGTDS